MSKYVKQLLTDHLRNQWQGVGAALLVNVSGMNPNASMKLRRELRQKNIRLQGSFSHNYPVWERVIHLLATGMAKPEIVVGLRSGLPGWRRAFDAMHDGEVIKSVLLPSA